MTTTIEDQVNDLKFYIDKYSKDINNTTLRKQLDIQFQIFMAYTSKQTDFTPGYIHCPYPKQTKK